MFGQHAGKQLSGYDQGQRHLVHDVDSALNDQIAAGAFMWVMGSTVFLIPAMGITVMLLSPRRRGVRGRMVAAAR